jgi:hypothetical protein
VARQGYKSVLEACAEKLWVACFFGDFYERPEEVFRFIVECSDVLPHSDIVSLESSQEYSLDNRSPCTMASMNRSQRSISG